MIKIQLNYRLDRLAPNATHLVQEVNDEVVGAWVTAPDRDTTGHTFEIDGDSTSKVFDVLRLFISRLSVIPGIKVWVNQRVVLDNLGVTDIESD